MGTHNCPHLGHRITEMLTGRHLWSPTSCSKQNYHQHQIRSPTALTSHVAKTCRDGDPASRITFLFHSFAYVCTLIVNILIFNPPHFLANVLYATRIQQCACQLYCFVNCWGYVFPFILFQYSHLILLTTISPSVRSQLNYRLGV